MLGTEKRTKKEKKPGPTPSAVVMLGAAVWPGGEPSPTLERRAGHAAHLFLHEQADFLVLCGGLGKHPPTEAEVAAEICTAKGVAHEALILEDRSTTTLENLENARNLLARHGCSRVWVVTDRYHLPRAVLTARILGLRAKGSAPGTESIPSSRKQQIYSTLREIPAFFYYIGLAILCRLRRRV